MPWVGPVAGRVPRTFGRVAAACVGFPKASVVVTTSVEGFGAVEAGSTAATSLHPAGKLPASSPSKVSGGPTKPAAAGVARNAAITTRTARSWRQTDFIEASICEHRRDLDLAGRARK